MKKTLYQLFVFIPLFLIYSLIFNVDNCNCQWVQMPNGMGTTLSVSSFTVANSNNIFAGTTGSGIFLSTNNGVNWNIVNNGLTNPIVRSLAVIGTNIFAGTSGGVYISTNYGGLWTAINNGLTNPNIYALAVIGTNIFAGTYGSGVFISTNNGANWFQNSYGLSNLNVYSLAANGTNLFAGTYGGGVFFSTNNGLAWNPVNNGLTNLIVYSLASSGTNLFAGTYGGGVFLSTNNGGNWNTINSGLSNMYVLSLAALKGNNIFAGFDFSSGVFLSTNSGGNWVSKNEGFVTLSSIYSLLITNNYTYAGTNGQSVWRRPLADLIVPDAPVLISPVNNSFDNPLNLNLVWSKPLLATSYNVILATDSLFSNIVVNDSLLTDSLKALTSLLPFTNYYWKVRAKNTAGWGIFSSYFTFRTSTQWIQMPNGMGTGNIIIAMISNGTNIFAGSCDIGVFLSTNNGGNWNQVNSGLTDIRVLSLASSGINIFAGTRNGVFLTTNNGGNWTLAGLTGQETSALAINGTNIFAGTLNGAFLSTNNGGNWNAVNNGLTNLNVRSFALKGANIFAATYGGGVFLSTNNGGIWNAVNSGLTNLNTFALSTSGMNLFVGTHGGGIFISTNNGGNWSAVNSGLTDLSIFTFAVSGTNLFTGTNTNGIFFSSNNGGNWISRNEGFITITTIYSLLMANNYIFAGTTGQSVWRRDFIVPLPNSPVLISPANNSVDNPLNLNLVWTKPQTATGYNVILATDSLFTNIILNDSLLTDSIKWLSNLTQGTNYYWKVRAKNSSGWGVFSSYFTFRTISQQWVQMPGGMGTNRDINALTVINGTNILAGISGGVYLSTNNGNNWNQVNNGLTNLNVSTLSSIGTYIFAGTGGGGVFLSINNGANWSAINSGLTNLYVNTLSSNGTNLFAGTQYGGVFFSSNNGVNWTQVNSGLANLNIHSLTSMGINIFAGTYGGGVFLSTNNGQNWIVVNSGLTNLNVLAFAISGKNIFVGTDGGGVFLSTNYGGNWSLLNGGLTNLNIRSLTASGCTLFAGTYNGGVFLSTNFGGNWTVKNDGFVSTPIVNSLIITNNYTYAGTLGQSVWRCISLLPLPIAPELLSPANNSNDIQLNPNLVWSKPEYATGYNVILATDSLFTNIIIDDSLLIDTTKSLTNLATLTNYYWKVRAKDSAGWGPFCNYFKFKTCISWVQMPNGMGTNQTVREFTTLGINIFAGTQGNGVFLTTNNGENWIPRGLTYATILSLNTIGTNIFAGTWGSGIYLTTNSGESWNWSNNGLTNLNIYAIASSRDNIFTGTYGGGVFLSTNNGGNWNPVNNGLTNQTVHSLAVRGTNIFAGTSGGVFLSTNNGGNWTAINSGLTNPQVNTLAMSGNNLFAGTDGGGVFISTNNGGSWGAINNGLTSLIVVSLTASGNNIFAGTLGKGVFLSTNIGGNWSAINQGFITLPPCVYKLFLANNYIFAGIDQSVWRRDFIVPLPDAPALISPANFSTDNPSNLNLVWSKPQTATGYNVVLATDSLFTNIILNDSLLTDSIEAPNNLLLATNYYWKVRAKNSTGWGVFSSYFTFKTCSQQWVQIPNGMGTNQYVYVLKSSGANMFAGTSSGVFLSNNNGGNWSAVNSGLTNLNIRSFASIGINIFTGTYGGGVFLSTDNGGNWSAVNSGLINPQINALTVSGTNIFAGTYGSGIFLSTNNGGNWNAVNSGLINPQINALTVSGANILAGTNGSGIYLSTNYGGSWMNVSGGLTNFIIQSFSSIGNNILAGTQGGVFISIDNVFYWNPTNYGLTNINVHSLATIGDNLFAGTDGGVFLSTNSGGNWSAINQGFLTIPSIYSLLLANNYIFAGTAGQSVWRRDFVVPLPDTPILINPANNSTSNLINLNLVWTKPLTATGYNAVLATDSLFTNIVINDSLLTDSIKSLTNLSPLTNYYWKVRAKNTVGWGVFSTAFKFKTQGVPTTVILSEPANNAINQPINITFKWTKAVDQTFAMSNEQLIMNNVRVKTNKKDSPDAISNYWFEYSSDSTFSTGVIRDTTLTDTTKSVTWLNKKTKHFWRVKAKNQTGWGSFSAIWNFTTTYNIDSVSPGQNKLNIPLTSNIKAYFKQSMNGSSLDSNSITFFGSMTGRKRGVISYNSGNNSMQIVPYSPFKFGELISATLDTGIKTGSGISIVPYVWSFMTTEKPSNLVLNQTSVFGGEYYPLGIAVGDFDNDGDLDLATTNESYNSVSIFKNNGTSNFILSQWINVGNNPFAITAGDFDGDGILDLAVTVINSSNSISILKNNGSGTFSLSSTIGVASSPVGITTADFDEDGSLDLAVTNYDSYIVSILKNNGSGTFALTSTIGVASSPEGITTGDFDGDGYIDIALANYSSSLVSILKNNGSGSFIVSSTLVTDHPNEIISGDYDKDGYLDLAVTNNNINKVSILKNSGNGTFSVSSSIIVGNVPYGIATGDLDGDGNLDLSVANINSNSVSILKNNGSGNFTLLSSIGVGSHPNEIKIGDFNNDGVLDITVTNGLSNNLSILINLVPPVLLTPINNSTSNLSSLNFNWNKALGASNYRIQIATDSMFNNLVLNDSTLFGTDSVKLVSGLSSLTWYYWRMNSKSSNGLSLWSDTWKFKTLGVPTQVSLLEPANNAVNQPVNITFKWTKAVDQTLAMSNEQLIMNNERAKTNNNDNKKDSPDAISKYWFEYSSDSTFTTGVIRDSSLADTTKTVSGLNNFTKYFWRVKALNQIGWGLFSSAWNFTTIPPIPSAPLLTSPATGSLDISLSPTLDWGDVTYAASYRLQISTDSLFGITLWDTTGITISQANVPSGKLTTLTKYYWRVNAANIAGTGIWSLVWNFTTIPNAPNVPVLSQPANGSTNQPINITFKWYKSIETLESQTPKVKSETSKEKRLTSDFSPFTISKYWFEYSTDSTFLTGVARDTSLVDTIKAVSGLNNITKYYWRVKAKNQIGWGNFCSTWNFTTIVPIPSSPVLTSPATGSIDISLTPLLDWGDVTYASSYRLQISTDSLFGTTLWDTTGITISQVNIPSGKLSTLTKYYWRVNASNIAGTGLWSLVWNFTTIPGVPNAPVLLLPPNGGSSSSPVTFVWRKSVETFSIMNVERSEIPMNSRIGKVSIVNNEKRLTSDFSPLTVSKYWHEYTIDSTFATGVIRDSSLTDTVKTTSIGPGLYWWRVKAKNQTGWGPFSVVWKFGVNPPVPAAPVLLLPPNNSGVVSLIPLMDWNDVTYASSYRLQISTDSLFGSTQWDTSGVAVSQVTVPSGKLTGLTKYYWRVNATNVAGTSPWSFVWNFTTIQNLSINFEVYMEGFWNGTSQVQDTVRVYLAMGTSPYTLKDSATAFLSTSGTATPVFTKAVNGNYYIVVMHRNHLETWSRFPQTFVTGIPVTYNFTDSSSAYGFAMKKVGNVWVTFGGDPNQDGEISAMDIPIFISEFGLTGGYFSCDFNGDGDVNATDVQIIAANFGITKSVPALDFEGSKVKKLKRETSNERGERSNVKSKR
jgi:hypothetical protein